jgi:acetyltransferase-like isoleucine patch superfamily enzyme
MGTLPEGFYEIGADAQVDEGVTLGYRFAGCQNKLIVGDHAVICSGTIIYADTVIGNRLSCMHHVLVRGQCQLGDRVVLWHRVTLEGRITVGYGVKFMANVYIPSGTRIGNMVFIGPNTTFLNAKYPLLCPGPVQGPTIEDFVVIGGGATICPGVTIGQHSFIGAGAVVNKDVPPYTLAMGVPARFSPLPDEFRQGPLPELLLPQFDLFGLPMDESWREEDYPGKGS